MIRSMTGFGAGRSVAEGVELRAELRSVNGRYLDVKISLPPRLSVLEPRVLRLARDNLHRGRVELVVREFSSGGSAVRPRADLALARAYRDELFRMAEALGMEPKVELSLLANFRELITLEDAEVDLEAAWEALSGLLSRALQELIQSRETEGAHLARDLQAHLKRLQEEVAEISQEADGVAQTLRDRIQARVEQLVTNELDPARVAQEIAHQADRADISEELARLAAHIEAFEALLSNDDPGSGRRMDFLLQEMGREVNTIGSKSCLASVSARVVEAKAILEKLREQAQNVE